MTTSTPKQRFIKILHKTGKMIAYSKKFDMADTIILTGSPRSGTTWLMEIFGAIPGYTFLFEPLSPIYFPESFSVGYRSRTYLPIDKNWPEGEEYMKNILTGYNVSLSPRQLLSNKLIVKFVRLNRLLPWVADRFKVRKTFLIIRHPCAVVSSQIEREFCGYHPTSPPYVDIFPTVENILEEASEINELNEGLLNKLRKINTLDEILAAIWCLDNYIPLSSKKQHLWTVLTYEKLVKDGVKEITRLFGELEEKNIPEAAFKRLKIPSALALKKVGDRVIEDETVVNTDKQLSKWKKKLSEKQIERILKIVSDFGLDFYTEDLEPDYNNISL